MSIMSDSSKLLWKLGALQGAAAVTLGAFGAHGLKSIVSDPRRLANWGTAAHYQLIHAVVILVAAREHRTTAGHLFNVGATLFSGSIYALVLAPHLKFLGPVTPLGGLAMIGGWLSLAFDWGN